MGNYIYCIFLMLLYFIIFFLLPVELFNSCCRRIEGGDWEEGELLPNKHTFFYFILNGLLILNVLCFFFGAIPKSVIRDFLIGIGVIDVIWTIIYIVRCCQNPKSYCTDISSGEYILHLIAYPCFYFDNYIKRECCCSNEYNIIVAAIIFGLLYFLLVVEAIIGYYSFLVVFIIFWLLLKMFYLCFSCEYEHCAIVVVLDVVNVVNVAIVVLVALKRKIKIFHMIM